MEDLSGKTILVTGTSKGIGSEIARVLGNSGANVIAHYGKDLEGAKKATAQIPDHQKILISADLSDVNGYQKLWSSALEWQGKIDVLIPDGRNNVNIMFFNLSIISF